MKSKFLLSGLLIALLLMFGTAESFAATLDAESQSLFDKAVTAIKNDAASEAIADLEQLADRGVLQPDVSFNRAIAYVKRAHTAHAQPGDFGRAVAALEETLILRPTDASAAAALTAVQAELSRERSKRGSQSLLERPPLGRAIVELVPENFWAVAALATSVLCSVGLLAAWLARSQRRRFIGKVVASIAGVCCLLTATLLHAAVQIRQHNRTAVVIAPEARLRDAAGIPLPVTITRDTASIPEGARVDVTSVGERYSEVLWGESRAFVESSDLELLPRR